MSLKSKINAAVIHPVDGVRREIAETLAGFSLLNCTGVYPGPEQFFEHRDRKQEPEQVFFVGESETLKTAEMLRNHEYPNIVVIRDPLPESYEDLVRADQRRMKIANNPIFRQYAKMPNQMLSEDMASGAITNMNDLFSLGFVKRIFFYLAKKRQLNRKINVAVFGLGKLGSGTALRLVTQNWVDNIYIASNSLKTEEALHDHPCWIDTREMIGATKVKPLLDAEELVETDADIYLVCTGPNKDEIQYGVTREEFTEANFIPTVKKDIPFIHAYGRRGNGGLVAMMSHPPGPILDGMLRRYNKLDESLLTTFPIDTYRAQEKTFVALREKIPGKPYLTREKIPVNCLWGHGEDAAIDFKNDRIPTYHPIDLFPFLSPADKENINKKVCDEGRKIMSRAIESGINYAGVPEIITECLDMLAHYEQKPSFTWYAHIKESVLRTTLSGDIPKQGAYLMVPVNVTYDPLGIRFSEEDFDLNKLTPDLHQKLQQTLIKQARRAKVALEMLS